MFHSFAQHAKFLLLGCGVKKFTNNLRLFTYLRRYGFETHSLLGCHHLFTKLETSEILSVQQVLDNLENQDRFLQDPLINEPHKYGRLDQAVMLNNSMRRDASLLPYAREYVSLIGACTKKKDFQRGVQIHAEITKHGLLEKDPFICSALLDMYLKCGALAKAQELFNNDLFNDRISWTALISAYARVGQHKEALHSFEKMQKHGILPDSVTFICCLKACAGIQAIDMGYRMHAEIEKQGLLQTDLVLDTALVDMYAKCGLLAKAKDVLDNLTIQTIVAWNALISGCIKRGLGMEALAYFDEMQNKGISSDAVTFICAFKACGIIGDIERGQKLHDEAEQKGFLSSDVVVGTAILNMYAKWGWLMKAQQLFDTLPARNLVSWNALIAGYVEHGYSHQALDCLERMHNEGIAPDAVTYACGLNACAAVGTAYRGQDIHAELVRRGILNNDPVVCNSLVDMYGKCGWLTKAHEVFDKLSVQNVVSWNALISGYVEHGCYNEAIACYARMQAEGATPDLVTYLCSLKACSNAGDTEMGCEIHDEIIRKGLMGADVDVGNALVDMYSKFGFYVKAKQVFDSLSVRDKVSWNAILLACTEHGHGEGALQYFEQMQSEGIPADAISLGACLKACTCMRAWRRGQVLHLKIHGGPFEYDIIIGTVLIDFYAKCGSLDRAHELFDNFVVKDEVTWNTLISGYADQGDGESALKCFEFMQLAGVNPNAITFLCSLKACGIVRAANVGMQIHAEICRRSLLNRELIGNTLVNMYAKCGKIIKAQEVFYALPVRDVVSWTVLIAGLTENGFFAEALDCYKKMQHEGVLPNSVTYVLSLKTCAIIGATDKGHEIHSEVERLGILVNNLAVSNALIDMYAKSGLVPMAQEVFDHLPHRGVACFNSLIAGYAHLGDNAVVFILLDRMRGENLMPDGVTYLMVLNACCQSSLFDIGLTHFEVMSKKYGIVPSLEHFTCLIDLLGRVGDFDKATELIKKLPFSPDSVLWLSMLSACGKWGNKKFGMKAFDHAKCLNEQNAAHYIPFSNIIGMY
ncbi:hypothetical protein KP509_31G048400 [Ceratopteris richardii]|uniref:Pentatricopeptide repeat-containing protein n=4 Tax=Ceratopteris richardii TaxID=49495 RepID=A0A8T2QZ80_CERRI|nr:hypothetical protein KP509_31G048400 [Ceratopteris richardii]